MLSPSRYFILHDMYVGVDIGATKTEIATFSKDGELLESDRYKTPKNYPQFIADLKRHYLGLVGGDRVTAGCVAVPGLIDRQKGTVIALGNLSWRNKSIRSDVAHALNGLAIVIENDSRLAGLSEAQYLLGKYRQVLYITISTGIGGALLVDGKIVEALQDTELGKIPLHYHGAIAHWENFAGGRAIVARYGKPAKDVHDNKSWKEIGHNIGYGLAVVSSVIQPDVIVFGGGVGQFSNKFAGYVSDSMNKHLHAVAKRPKLLAARHPEEAVLYGCYMLAKEIAL